MPPVVVTQAKNLDVDDVYPLVLKSENEGFRFVRRFYDDYVGGTNRFDHYGEALFVARQPNQVVGICGLNQDPYSTGKVVGRVRKVVRASRFPGARCRKAVGFQRYFGGKTVL